MRFKFIIETGVPGTNVLDDFNPGKGMDLVEAVRALTGEQDLAISNIELADQCVITRKCIEFQYTSTDKKQLKDSRSARGAVTNERLINNIPQFEAGSMVRIYVPEGYAGLYYELTTTRYLTDLETVFPNFSSVFKPSSWFKFVCCTLDIGPVNTRWKKVEADYVFDHVQFIQDWIKAGCPEYFGITEERVKDLLEAERQRCEEIKRKYEEDKRKTEAKEAEEQAAYEEKERQRIAELGGDAGRAAIVHLADDLRIISERFARLMEVHYDDEDEQ